MRKVNRKQASVITTLLVSISMSAVMPVGMILFKLGFCENLAELWLMDFLLGCCIAIPSGLIIVPLVERLVKTLTYSNNNF